MRKKDTMDVLFSSIAVAADAYACVVGFILATWLRFDSGWLAVPFGRRPDLYAHYLQGAIGGTIILLVIFRGLGLYARPQTGRFESKIPRQVRAIGIGLITCTVLAFAFRNYHAYSYSAMTMAISMVTLVFTVLFERYILFRLELHSYRHSPATNRVLILGTNDVAARLTQTLEHEPRLRAKVTGFLRTDDSDPSSSIPAGKILGNALDIAAITAQHGRIDQLILVDSKLSHDRIVDIILLCDRNMIRFNMVPDLFWIMTGSIDMESIEDIPLLGLSRWPLDYFWNRVLKRTEDILGAFAGLVISAPAIALAAIMVKASSPGPIFYRQERCGETGTVFSLIKVRTMKIDAEEDSGPVFTQRDDPRVTGVGAFLRRHNLDELPQLWNVLRGDMSLVGPRPERPYFVEQFKTEIGRYMWRHVSKPGVTGWAQVNGLRGDTSIQDRIKYDLYYLENWSLSFDFKIIAKTLRARENAY